MDTKSPARTKNTSSPLADTPTGEGTATSNMTQPQPKLTFRPSGSATKVGLIGAGNIAEFHLDVLKATPNVEIVAICDLSESRAKEAADRYGVQNAVTSVQELVDLGVEVVHLAVPPDFHVSMTKELLEAGLGVFGEKPIALNSADALMLAELAEKKNLPLVVNHNNVFHPSFQKMLERIEAGEIGRVQHVQVTLSVPLAQLDANDYTHWMFRTPRNIVFEQAVHPLSQMHRLLGKVETANTTLLGSKELLPGLTFYDRWSTAFKAEKGTAQLYMAFGQPFTRSTMQVLGTDGSLEADMFHDQLAGEEKTVYLDFWNSYKAGISRSKGLKKDARRVLKNWSMFTLGIGARRDAFFMGMQGSIQAFHAALRAGQPLPNDAQAGLEVTQWADALAGDVSSQIPPVPEFPEPGEARENEVVVLGGTGFIGRRVVSRLLEQGANVSCVVRRTFSLPEQIVQEGLSGKIRILRASLSDEEGLKEALKGAKTCIHLATGNGDTWEEVERVMVNGSAKVAEICSESGVKRLVYVSSVAALNTGGSTPIKDSWDVDSELDKRALYSVGKAKTEQALKAVADRTGLGLVVARPGVVVGDGTPLQHSGLGMWARDNHCVGWGLGDCALPLVLADDVADGLVAAALAPGKGVDGEALNLCANPGLTGQDMVAELARATGRRLKFHPRSLVLSQTMEVGKWVIKRVGGRKAEFPSYRDLKARSLSNPFTSDIAREKLGWKPVEDRANFIKMAVDIYAPK
ncbi:MAG: putative dehydrogenase/nucleoside-diphosphate-sugar epimerase [Glaciecola sp.]|jgi:predicted dehydrogenase/nucleoside-diphosphate-sugar epimerase